MQTYALAARPKLGGCTCKSQTLEYFEVGEAMTSWRFVLGLRRQMVLDSAWGPGNWTAAARFCHGTALDLGQSAMALAPAGGRLRCYILREVFGFWVSAREVRRARAKYNAW